MGVVGDGRLDGLNQPAPTIVYWPMENNRDMAYVVRSPRVGRPGFFPRVARRKSTRSWAIQELAGHADLSMTRRYMHVSPTATEDAIRLLDTRQAGFSWRIVETSFWTLETRRS